MLDLLFIFLTFQRKVTVLDNKIKISELPINKDGSIYHLKLHPEQIAHDIIIVGDPGRVKKVSAHFDKIEVEVHNREFLTHTGYFNGKRISAISTGMGTDNIDIFLNELDALVNIDFEKRAPKSELTSLNIIRLGTSGALQEDIPVDSIVVAEYGLGLDGLLNFYTPEYSTQETVLNNAFIEQTNWPQELARPYIIKGNEGLIEKLGEGYVKGITATACGFYAPQGRQVRLDIKVPDINERLRAFQHEGNKVLNFEMETSALYGLSKLMGHNACTMCAVIANRFSKTFSKDYQLTIDKLIENTLQRLTA